jgi:hypothetical protein
VNRSQTSADAHVDGAHAAHPLLPTAHDWTVVLLVGAHCVVPVVHALVQHAPWLHAPLVHDDVDPS